MFDKILAANVHIAGATTDGMPAILTLIKEPAELEPLSYFVAAAEPELAQSQFGLPVKHSNAGIS